MSDELASEVLFEQARRLDVMAQGLPWWRWLRRRSLERQATQMRWAARNELDHEAAVRAGRIRYPA